MAVDIEKPMDVQYSSFRTFYPGERHVSRLCETNVLIFMISGVLRFGEEGVQMQVHGGEYYVQRGGKRQDGDIVSDSPHYFYVHFDGSFTDGEGLPEKGRWDEKRLMPFIERLDAAQKSGASRLKKSLCFFALIDELCESLRAAPNTLAERVKAEIVSSVGSDMRLKDIADSLFVSVNYLIRAFKREYGETPHKYLTELRLSEAKTLLRDTTRTEEEIAESVGYSEFSVFYKAFRARYGVSPSVIRKGQL